MGIDCASAKFLCAAKSMGVDFAQTLTVGRQWHMMEAGTLQQISSALGISCDPLVTGARSKFAEPFFTWLGAQEVQSLDASAYEGANYVHDLNLPLPAHLSQRFSVVHDGGSLEHVFNLPQAFKNCMEMVRVGGHFTQVTGANNFMGHGFWQLSPELIFRVFTPENGYRIVVVLLHEVEPQGAWYVVQDPSEIRKRVELCNGVPTYLLTIAQRVAAVEVFAAAPQQSDYSAAWGANANSPRASIAISPTGYSQIDEAALLRGRITSAQRPDASQPRRRPGLGTRASQRIPPHISVFAQLNLQREYLHVKNRGFAQPTDLCDVMASFGSDKGKGWHNYTIVYDALFSRFRNEHLALFELGIGTNKVGAPSSMGPTGRPGASLRAWREYFSNAQVFAADVDRDILFAEDRIQTLWVDQRQSYAIRELWRELEGVTFDIMIDDGLHEASANIRFFIESFDRLKAGGIYVIEDVRHVDTEAIAWLARCAAQVCRCVVIAELPHPTNRIDNRLVIFQKT